MVELEGDIDTLFLGDFSDESIVKIEAENFSSTCSDTLEREDTLLDSPTTTVLNESDVSETSACFLTYIDHMGYEDVDTDYYYYDHVTLNSGIYVDSTKEGIDPIIHGFKEWKDGSYDKEYGSLLDFKPNDYITREQAVKIIVRGLCLLYHYQETENTTVSSSTIENKFNDISSSDWIHDEANVAHLIEVDKESLLNGYIEEDKRNLKPTEVIDRKQFIKMLMVGYGYATGDECEIESNYSGDSIFPDVELEEWDGELVQWFNCAYEKNIYVGSDGNARPNTYITRGEAIFHIYNTMVAMGEIENTVVITSPDMDEIITDEDRDVNIIWTELEDIDSYEVELTIDEGFFDWGDTEVYSVNSTSMIATGDGDNDYRVRIRGVYDDDMYSPWSSYTYFSFDTSGS